MGEMSYTTGLPHGKGLRIYVSEDTKTSTSNSQSDSDKLSTNSKGPTVSNGPSGPSSSADARVVGGKFGPRKILCYEGAWKNG